MNYIPTWMILAGLMFAPSLWAEDHEDHDPDEVEWFKQDMEDLKEIEGTILKYIRRVEPRAIESMTYMAKEDEEEYWEIITELAEALEEIAEITEEEPKFAKLYERILQTEIKMEYLGSAIQSMESEEEREAMKAELRLLLPSAFDDRMKEAEMELSFLRQEIAEVETDWKRRMANKEKIMERRFQELTGADDALDW